MEYYEESGKLSLPGLIIAFPICIALVCGIGYGYAVITELNPLIYLNFLVGFGYIFCVAFVLYGLKWIGKVRNSKVMILLGIVLTLIGLGFTWVSYFAAYFDQSMVNAYERFGWFYDLSARAGMSIGRFGRGNGLEISGMWMKVLWLIEAGFLVIGPLLAISKVGGQQSVFCEKCNSWADKESEFLLDLEGRVAKDQLISELSSKGIPAFLQRKKANPTDRLFHRAIIKRCNKCEDTAYMKVEQVENTRNSKGEMEEEETELIEYFRIRKDQIPPETVFS